MHMNNPEILTDDQPIPADAKALAPFHTYRQKFRELATVAQAITVTDINDTKGMKAARAARLALREVRIAVEKKRKELTEHHLRAKQAVDEDARELRALIEPLEAKCLEAEEFGEREAFRIASELRASRANEIAPYLIAPVAMDLAVLTAEQWRQTLDDAKAAHAARLERERIAREEVAAKAKAEAEERERLRAENERLRKERAEQEAAAAKVREEQEAARRAILKAEAEARAALMREQLAKEKAEAQRVEMEREKVRVEQEAARRAIEAEKLRAKAEQAAAAPPPESPAKAGPLERKYIVFTSPDGIENPVIFPAWVQHSDVAAAMKKLFWQPVGAGFLRLQPATPYGQSESLGIAARAEDAELFQ